MGIGTSKSCEKPDCRDASQAHRYKELRREIMIYDRALFSKPEKLDASCIREYDRTTPSPLETCRSLKRGLTYRWKGKKFDCDSWGVFKYKELPPGHKCGPTAFIWYTPIKFHWGCVHPGVGSRSEPGCYCNRIKSLVMIQDLMLLELSKHYGQEIVDGFVANVCDYIAPQLPTVKRSCPIDGCSLTSDDEKAYLLEKTD